jgi:hypothetical protein
VTDRENTRSRLDALIDPFDLTCVSQIVPGAAVMRPSVSPAIAERLAVIGH